MPFSHQFTVCTLFIITTDVDTVEEITATMKSPMKKRTVAVRKVDVGVVEELLWQQLAAIMHQPNLKPQLLLLQKP